jgi:hypothetical protein
MILPGEKCPDGYKEIFKKYMKDNHPEISLVELSSRNCEIIKTLKENTTDELNLNNICSIPKQKNYKVIRNGIISTQKITLNTDVIDFDLNNEILFGGKGCKTVILDNLKEKNIKPLSISAEKIGKTGSPTITTTVLCGTLPQEINFETDILIPDNPIIQSTEKFNFIDKTVKNNYTYILVIILSLIVLYQIIK